MFWFLIFVLFRGPFGPWSVTPPAPAPIHGLPPIHATPEHLRRF